MSEVRLLDCTLRDGGHITAGKFGKNAISAIIRNLVKANIDIVEAGFLWDTETDDDTARFHTIGEVKQYLPSDMGNTKISLMADNVDVTHLEPYDGTVEYIRLSFRKTEFDWAKKSLDSLKSKGYKVFINPIHGSSYSDQEFLKIIEWVNENKPYGFSIVDTFGAMRQADLGRLYFLIEHNLDKNITLGVHLHQNLGLAYSLAQYILSIVSPTRNIIIDGSLYGMGKVPGNLCIEQIMDFLNIEYNKSYSTEPVYDAIDEYIMPIYEKVSWGYTIPYAISAQCSVHRTYAEFLTKKERLRTKDIRRILNSITPDKAEIFDKEYAESLYRNYMEQDFHDDSGLSKLKDQIGKYQKVIVIAPGSTLNSYSFDPELVKDSCSISVNFIYDGFKTTYSFFSNVKRIGYYQNESYSNAIITSNLINDVDNPGYIISRNELVYHGDVYSDDSTLMLLNLLKACGGNHDIYIAGFDGFDKGVQNFYNGMVEKNVRSEDYSTDTRMNILKNNYSTMNIHFLTRSKYEDAFND